MSPSRHQVSGRCGCDPVRTGRFHIKPANASRQPGRGRQRYGRCIMPVRQKLKAKPGPSSHVFRSRETKAI